MKKKERLATIANIIESIENRCMACDGPVTPTTKEITEDELRKIYQLAKGTYASDGQTSTGITASDRWATIEALMILGEVTMEHRQDGGYGILLEPVENIASQEWVGDTPGQAVDAVVLRMKDGD